MWGRLSEFVQDKLDTSGVEEENNSGEIVRIFVHISSLVLLLILLLVQFNNTCADVRMYIFPGECQSYHRKPTECSE
jgi:hypothetical protein